MQENNIPFKEQVRADLEFNNKNVGKYFLDFLIGEKIVLEIKRREYFSKSDIEQIYSYQSTKFYLCSVEHINFTNLCALI